MEQYFCEKRTTRRSVHGAQAEHIPGSAATIGNRITEQWNACCVLYFYCSINNPFRIHIL